MFTISSHVSGTISFPSPLPPLTYAARIPKIGGLLGLTAKY